MKAWEMNIRKVIPYTPGEQPNQPDMIKLNTNENPYPPAREAARMMAELNPEELRLYPDPSADVLVSALADYYHLDKDQVFVGVGSDDVLAMAFMTFFNSRQPILFPDITYSFYDVWADLLRIPYKCQPLNAHFEIEKKDYEQPNGGIVIPNPNAPTGILQDLADIEDIIRRNADVIVIIDEAYIDFGGVSALSLIDKYENLLVVQTYSKSRSMAGIRIGYAMGNKTLIKYLNDVKYSFNSYTMNRPSLEIGAEVLKNEVYFREVTGKIIATRERVKVEMKELGFHFADSQANFLFVTHEKYWARDLFQALKLKHIYVRYFNRPRIDNYLRITIGTDEEMDALIGFFKEYMKEN